MMTLYQHYCHLQNLGACPLGIWPSGARESPPPIWQRFESPLPSPNSVCVCVVQISISRSKKKKKTWRFIIDSMSLMKQSTLRSTSFRFLQKRVNKIHFNRFLIIVKLKSPSFKLKSQRKKCKIIFLVLKMFNLGPGEGKTPKPSLKTTSARLSQLIDTQSNECYNLSYCHFAKSQERTYLPNIYIFCSFAFKIQAKLHKPP